MSSIVFKCIVLSLLILRLRKTRNDFKSKRDSAPKITTEHPPKRENKPPVSNTLRFQFTKKMCPTRQFTQNK